MDEEELCLKFCANTVSANNEGMFNEEMYKELVRDKIPSIELTILKEIVDSVEICFDPDDMNTLIEQDKDIMSQYFEFEKMVDEFAYY